jgi:hypothetical protein
MIQPSYLLAADFEPGIPDLSNVHQVATWQAGQAVSRVPAD